VWALLEKFDPATTSNNAAGIPEFMPNEGRILTLKFNSLEVRIKIRDIV
jgi:hypothetical protein